MKSKIFLTFAILLLFGFIIKSNGTGLTNNGEQQPPIIVYASPDLTNLSNGFINEFENVFPDGNFISADQMPATQEKGKHYLGFVTEEAYANLLEKPGWRMVIGRDVIVPVISSANPLFQAEEQKAISSNGLIKLFMNDGTATWGTLLGNQDSKPINLFSLNDNTIQSGIDDYLGISKRLNDFKYLGSANELVTRIQADPYSMGFCRLTDVIDPNQQSLIEGIRLLPIDKNGNGSIDYHENIYGSLSEFMRGVWIGKYPKQLIQNIYAISDSKPENASTIGFLKWVITDGQNLLGSSGHSALVYTERPNKLDALVSPINIEQTNPNNYRLVKIVLIAFAALAIFGFILNIILTRKKKALVSSDNSDRDIKTINANNLNIPKGLYFDKTHTWVFMDQDGMVKIGLDDFLQHVTGPFTKIKMKNPGEKVKKHEQIMTLVQDGKQLNIYAPVSGTIKEINETLVTDPFVINDSPYQDGWVYMMEPSNWLREIQFLRMADKYKEWLQYEFTRLKDFLAGTINSGQVELAHVTYQEGGELKDQVLRDQGPQIWEDFQKQFVDVSGLY
jgi:glycine cleavage system H lipoate-binding protein